MYKTSIIVHGTNYIHLKRRCYSSLRYSAGLGQRSLGHGGVRADTVHPRVPLNAVADNNGFVPTRAGNGEVPECDVLAHGIGVRRAAELGNDGPVLPAGVARKVLEEDVGHVHLGGVLFAGFGRDLILEMRVSCRDTWHAGRGRQETYIEITGVNLHGEVIVCLPEVPRQTLAFTQTGMY